MSTNAAHETTTRETTIEGFGNPVHPTVSRTRTLRDWSSIRCAP